MTGSQPVYHHHKGVFHAKTYSNIVCFLVGYTSKILDKSKALKMQKGDVIRKKFPRHKKTKPIIAKNIGPNYD